MKVEIPGSSGELKGLLLRAENATGRAALFIHAYESAGHSFKQSAKSLKNKGTAALLFDLSGHGKSEGDLSETTVQDHINDAGAAFDYLAEQNMVDAGRIGVVGTSYGGYLAAQLSRVRPVKALLMHAPPLYPDEYRNRPRYSYQPPDVLTAPVDDNNSTLQALRSFAGSASLVISQHDSVISDEHTNAYWAAINQDKIILDRAGHSISGQSRPYFDLILAEWAAEL
jgi:pimeloyl-ACP methyl ester carboxylesterase